MVIIEIWERSERGKDYYFLCNRVCEDGDFIGDIVRDAELNSDRYLTIRSVDNSPSKVKEFGIKPNPPEARLIKQGELDDKNN